MLVVSLAEFNDNFKTYSQPVQIEENGKTIGKFIPSKTSFFSRIFTKKDDTIDGVHHPKRSLKAALRESKKMGKHPEKYKLYDNPKELWDELGL